MKLEWKTNVIDLLTLIVLIVGGILGYFLIDIQKTEESIANTNLSRMQTEIAKIDKEYRKSIDDLEERLKRITVTANVSDLIAEVQPNIEIYLEPSFAFKNNTMDLTWEITNLGKHTVVISDHSILLSLNVISKNPNPDSLLKEGKDFCILSRDDIGELPPGQKTYHDWIIQFLNKKVVDKVYHYSKWETKFTLRLTNLRRKFLVNILVMKKLMDLQHEVLGDMDGSY